MPTHYPGTPAEIRALNAHIKLMRAAGTLKARMDRWVMGHGLTESQFGVLETLLYLGPLSPSAISQKRLSSGANITTVLDNLEKRELIRRDPSETDGRCSRVQLTPEGRRLISRIFPAHVAAIRQVYAALSAEEQEALGTLSRKLGLANVEAPSRRTPGARRAAAARARRALQPAGRK
jgi:MarR family transcriptional regulator, 2-MHQ and catechol-resistance regulon repressor